MAGPPGLAAHDLQQPPLDRSEHSGQLVAALEHLAVLAEQRPHALAAAQRGTFLEAHLGDFGGAAESGEDRAIAGEVHRVVAPLAGADHAAVEIEDAAELGAVEAD